jgi:outer membrane lipoprotein-sorting protein
MAMMTVLRAAIVSLIVLTGYSAMAQQYTSYPDAPSQHKFFDRQNKIAFGTLAGLIAADSVTTQRLTNSGRAREANPIWRPMVRQGWAGQTAASALGFASALGVAYTFHKTGHHKMERWANWLTVSFEGANDARNIYMDASH